MLHTHRRELDVMELMGSQSKVSLDGTARTAVLGKMGKIQQCPDLPEQALPGQQAEMELMEKMLRKELSLTASYPQFRN